jgi:outer membrane protein assembly factor BamA
MIKCDDNTSEKTRNIDHYSVRKNAGHTLKSAVGHSMTFDTRDDPLLPTKGLFFKTTQVGL